MPKSTLQAAALPWRDGRICMVTSRSGKRWVVPKGRIELGQTAQQTAAADACEEAGLKGNLSDSPIGSYRYVKFQVEYGVDVFLMLVDAVEDDWPEVEEREREWVSVAEALNRIDETELRRIVQLTAARMAAGVL